MRVSITQVSDLRGDFARRGPQPDPVMVDVAASMDIQAAADNACKELARAARIFRNLAAEFYREAHKISTVAADFESQAQSISGARVRYTQSAASYLERKALA